MKYYAYGAKGIAVCERWSDFATFLSDMGERPVGRTLDRIDNTGGYSPENCRWATPQEQQNNQSTTRFVNYGGCDLALSDLARMLGVRKNTLLYRIEQKWPEAEWGRKAWSGNRL